MHPGSGQILLVPRYDPFIVFAAGGKFVFESVFAFFEFHYFNIFCYWTNILIFCTAGWRLVIDETEQGFLFLICA